MFTDKLATAARLETAIRETHTGLRALSAFERENMAVLLYGPGATGDLNGQYYIPVGSSGIVVQTGKSKYGPVLACQNGTWDWVVNTAGNSLGVNYVNNVRSSIR